MPGSRMRRLKRTIGLASLGVLLALGTAAAPPPAPTAGGGGPITPADIMRLHDMRTVEMSPDGRTILFTVQPQISTFGPEHAAIWSVATDGRTPARRIVASAGVDDTPRWSPDGRSIAFLSNRTNPLAGGGNTAAPIRRDTASTPGAPVEGTPPPAAERPGVPSRQLWLIARDGDAVPLTALPTDIADLAWSPDGKRIAILSADRDTPAEQADLAAKRDWTVVDRPRHMTRLSILDVARHSVQPVSAPDVSISAVAWSPDGTRLAVRVTDTPSINDYFYHARIALIDPARGTIGAPLIDHAAEGPYWSPDGKAILGETIRTPGFIGLGVRVYDLTTGRTTALADDHPGLLNHVRWADNRSILALSFEQTTSRVVRIGRADGHVTRIAALAGEASDLTAATDGRRIAVALSSANRPADVWTIDGSRAVPLTTINPAVATWNLGDVRQVSWTNRRDGRTIYGVLVTPPGYVAGTPIKTVVQIHGGPEWAWWSGWLGSWHEWAQLLATHGYAVLLPNPRGSDGQGTAFARAVGNDWGGMDYQDVLDGVDMLVARKIADPARLGIGGWSYGGFMAAWAVTHGDRFKTAIVGAGPTDMTAMARITDTPDFTTGYFGDPAGHLADLDRVSSVRLLDAVHVPVLVLHGEADTRVPTTLGLEFYRGLRLLGKPVDMVRYPREPHWFHEPEHQADVQRRVLAWFDAHL